MTKISPHLWYTDKADEAATIGFSRRGSQFHQPRSAASGG